MGHPQNGRQQKGKSFLPLFLTMSMWVPPLAAPSLLYDSRASHREKTWDGVEGLQQIHGREELTCAILIKKTHLLRHQGPEEAVPKADVQACKDERKNAAPDTCGK